MRKNYGEQDGLKSVFAVAEKGAFKKILLILDQYESPESFMPKGKPWGPPGREHGYLGLKRIWFYYNLGGKSSITSAQTPLGRYVENYCRAKTIYESGNMDLEIFVGIVLELLAKGAKRSRRFERLIEQDAENSKHKDDLYYVLDAANQGIYKTIIDTLPFEAKAYMENMLGITKEKIPERKKAGTQRLAVDMEFAHKIERMIDADCRSIMENCGDHHVKFPALPIPEFPQPYFGPERPTPSAAASGSSENDCADVCDL